MKKWLIPVLTFSTFFCSCAGTFKTEKSAIEKQEIIADSQYCTIQIQSGKVCGYIDNGVYIYER